MGNDTKKGTKNAFFEAVKEGNLETANKILGSAKPNELNDLVNAKDKAGRTPLHYAAKFGRKTVFDLLVEKGANKETTDKLGLTPTETAILFNQTTITKESLTSAQSQLTEWLIVAAISGLTEEAQALIKVGADLKGFGKATPLLKAAEHGRTETVRALLEAGADLKGFGDLTPLLKAAERGHTETVRAILEAGADPQAEGMKSNFSHPEINQDINTFTTFYNNNHKRFEEIRDTEGPSAKKIKTLLSECMPPSEKKLGWQESELKAGLNREDVVQAGKVLSNLNKILEKNPSPSNQALKGFLNEQNLEFGSKLGMMAAAMKRYILTEKISPKSTLRIEPGRR